MPDVPFYPLRFEPIFQPRLWGGRRLGELLRKKLPDGPIGEAWVLSDQDDHPSRVADGPLAGMTLRQLMKQARQRLLGPVHHERFPLLLKFLDARDTLSVQVHPDDRHTELLPPGQRGKTEAWVVLEAEPASRIYAGFQAGVDAEHLQRALRDGTVADCLASFTPQPGDCVFLRAGVVHALGGGIVLFEVQQNSDVTFRLHDWGRVDAKGKPRQLHVAEALACTDFTAGAVRPRKPAAIAHESVVREQLARCEHFDLLRWQGDRPFTAGAVDQCRILVGLQGKAALEHRGEFYPLQTGDVVLLPAEVGACRCEPHGPITLLECTLG